MRRIAVLAVVGALLGIGVPAAVAAEEQDYDSFTVSAGPQKWNRSDGRLSSAYRYHLIVTGTSTTSGSDGGSAQFDAQYCFASTGPQCASPFPEDAAIGFAVGKEGGGQATVDALYSSGSFEGISEFGEGSGRFSPFDGGNTYEQYFTVGDTYSNLYAMTWRKYSEGDGVTRSGSFTVTIKRTPIAGGGGGGSTPPPSTPVPDTPGGSDSACTAGYRIAQAAGSPLPLFCFPEEFLAGSFGLPMDGPSLDPGEAATLTSPKLGSATTKTTVEVKAPPDVAVSVTDPGFKRFARMQCVTVVGNPDSVPVEGDDLLSSNGRLIAEVPFLAVSYFRQRFLTCIAIVNRLLEAAAVRKSEKLRAGTTAGGCRQVAVPGTYGRGTSLDRLRVRVGRKPKASRTLSVRCRRTAEGVAVTVATRKPGQPLKSIVGSRMSFAVQRAPGGSGGAAVSALFRR